MGQRIGDCCCYLVLNFHTDIHTQSLIYLGNNLASFSPLYRGKLRTEMNKLAGLWAPRGAARMQIWQSSTSLKIRQKLLQSLFQNHGFSPIEGASASQIEMFTLLQNFAGEKKNVLTSSPYLCIHWLFLAPLLWAMTAPTASPDSSVSLAFSCDWK